MKYKVYQVLLQVGGWLSLLAPITILCYMNREFYFRTVEDGVKVGIGIVSGIVIIGLIALKKIHLGALWIFLFAIGILELLKTILGDLELIMIVVGSSYATDKFIFMPLADYYEHIYRVYKDSMISARATKKIYGIQPIKQENMETRGIY